SATKRSSSFCSSIIALHCDKTSIILGIPLNLNRYTIHELGASPSGRRARVAFITEVCWRMNKCRVRCSVSRHGGVIKIPVILSISALQEVGESATICASLARFGAVCDAFSTRVCRGATSSQWFFGHQRLSPQRRNCSNERVPTYSWKSQSQFDNRTRCERGRRRFGRWQSHQRGEDLS